MFNIKFTMRLLVVFFGLTIHLAQASILIPMYLVVSHQTGKFIGRVKADDTIYGLMLTPHLHGLPPGIHGFHIHEQAFCSNGGMAAGGHLDPEHNNSHQGPYKGDGHLGDLPVLIVDDKGKSSLPVLAPRLKLASITGHSIIIQEGGDNYQDQPIMGGGGLRMACGVIPYF